MSLLTNERYDLKKLGTVHSIAPGEYADLDPLLAESSGPWCCSLVLDVRDEEGAHPSRAIVRPTTIVANLVLSGVSQQVGSVEFRLVYDDSALRPAPGAGGADGNPDLDEAGLGTGWSCSLPAGSGTPDIDSATGPGHGVALLVCHKTDPYVTPSDPVTIATFTFDVIAPGTHTVEIREAAIAGPAAAPVGSCNPVLDIEMTCIGGEIVASWD